MAEPELEVAPLISKLRSQTSTDLVRTGVVTLLNLIPFAGGAVAAVVGEFASRRKTEKICEILAYLNAQLDAHGAEPERHLSKDQIVEVVHETLQTATTTSDEVKLEALMQGLGYAFLAEDPFERKQVFLQLLRGTTVLELLAVRRVYDSDDPHIVREGSPVSGALAFQESGHLISGPKSTLRQSLLASGPGGRWEPLSNEERGQDTLLSFLAKALTLDEGMTAGVLQLLDSKGLTNSATNLRRTDSKLVRWVPLDITHVESVLGRADRYGTGVRPSPLEATRTKFGAEFLRVFRSDR